MVSLEQIKNLDKRFQQLSGNEETISKEKLESIPALANNPIRKQIIDAFFDKRNHHQDEVGDAEEIGFEQFLMVMSHFRPPTLKTTVEEKEAMRKEKLRCKILHFMFKNTIIYKRTRYSSWLRFSAVSLGPMSPFCMCLNCQENSAPASVHNKSVMWGSCFSHH